MKHPRQAEMPTDNLRHYVLTVNQRRATLDSGPFIPIMPVR